MLVQFPIWGVTNKAQIEVELIYADILGCSKALLFVIIQAAEFLVILFAVSYVPFCSSSIKSKYTFIAVTTWLVVGGSDHISLHSVLWYSHLRLMRFQDKK